MTMKTLLLAVAATPLLLGCTTTSDTKAKSGNSQMEPMTGYAANYRDGVKTNASEIETPGGLSGVIGKADGTLSDVQVRMNTDKTIAYVSVDGGPEVEFDSRTNFHESGNSYFYGSWYDEGGRRVYLHGSGDTYSDIQFYENGVTTAYGSFSLETAPEDLPETASYSGYFNTEGEIRAYGQLAAIVDFANGDVEGGMTGAVYNGTSFAGDTAAIYGTIDGSVSGSRIAGTTFVTGGATGALDFAGSASGPAAQQIQGGMAGSLAVDGEDFTTGGKFTLYDGGID